MADNPRNLVRIRHRTIKREGRVPRSALAYLDGWYEVEDKPRRRRTSAAKTAAAKPAEDGHSTTTKES